MSTRAILSVFAQDNEAKVVTVTMRPRDSMEVEDTMRYLGFRSIASCVGHEEAVEIIQELEESNYEFEADFTVI